MKAKKKEYWSARSELKKTQGVPSIRPIEEKEEKTSLNLDEYSDGE